MQPHDKGRISGTRVCASLLRQPLHENDSPESTQTAGYRMAVKGSSEEQG